MEQTDDAGLVRAARVGDKAAFGELISRHVRMAETLAGRVLQDRDLARDAVQEAAVLALIGLERLHAPERFGAWLAGIALNVARRWVRRSDAYLALPQDDGPDPAPGPDEKAELALLRERVRRAVAGLPPGQRDAVYLFYLQGLTHREVADELDISIGAVKARLHQGRASLAVRLAPEHTHPELTQENAMTETSSMVNVTIAQVLRGAEGSPGRRTHVVVLRETGGDRQLSIWIGEAEAVALVINLESEQMPRPMTYQFTADLLAAGGVSLREVRIARLDEKIYYATAIVDGPTGQDSTDARPSDALNLAAITGAPVLVDADLFADSKTPTKDMHEIYPTNATEPVAEMRELMTGGTGTRRRD